MDQPLDHHPERARFDRLGTNLVNRIGWFCITPQATPGSKRPSKGPLLHPFTERSICSQASFCPLWSEGLAESSPWSQQTTETANVAGPCMGEDTGQGSFLCLSSPIHAHTEARHNLALSFCRERLSDFMQEYKPMWVHTNDKWTLKCSEVQFSCGWPPGKSYTLSETCASLVRTGCQWDFQVFQLLVMLEIP